jgi:hypothetical protein
MPPASGAHHVQRLRDREKRIDRRALGSWEPTERRTADATLVLHFALPDDGFVGLALGSVEVSRDGHTFSATCTLEFPTAREGESTDLSLKASWVPWS